MRSLLSQLTHILCENKGVIWAFSIRGVGMFLGLLSGIVLARLLGPEHYGLYTLAMAWLTSLGLICAFGYDTSTLRFVGIFKDQNKIAHMKSFLNQARKESFTMSLIVAACVFGLGLGFSFINHIILYYIVIGLPVFTYLLVRMPVLRGYGEYVLAIGADNFLRNAVLVAVFGSLFFISGQKLTAHYPLITVLIASLLGIALVEWRIAHYIKTDMTEQNTSPTTKDHKEWRKASITLMVVNISRMILGKIDMAILPLFMSVAFAGVYDAAIKWVGLIWFAQNTLARVFGPQMAALHAKQDHISLQKHTTKITYLIFIPSALIALAIFVLGPFLMTLYGDYFITGVTTLRILIIGYLLTAFAGAAHLMINMLGDEKISMRISVETLIINIALNFVLIPLFGMEGAATATSISLIYMSAKRVYFLYKNHNINCLPFVTK